MISAALQDPDSLFDVSGKTVLITGGSGAFGRAVAIALSQKGANVAIAGGTKSDLEEVAEEIRSLGREPLVLNHRPDSLEDARMMRDKTIVRFGAVDLLVIASGYNKAGFIHEMDYADWQAVMDANVRGNWFMAKAVGSYWIKKEIKGKLLMVSSVRGRHGNISGYTAYCTSKGAVDSLTRVLATEWAQYGITVNTIAPTIFRSKLTAWTYSDDELGQATRKRSMSRIPLGRLGEPEDFVGMAIYLLSPASSFCTGQVMYIDGGFTAG